MSHKVLNGVWSAYILDLWGCYDGRPGAPDQNLVIPIDAVPADALVPPYGESSILKYIFLYEQCFRLWHWINV